MPFTIQKSTLCGVLFFSLSFTTPLFAAQLSVSTEVQANIKLLSESKNCPQCNLSGAILNRLDLSGANLEGADLSRAKFFLSNLSGANLKNSNLKEAEFGGADLANADLSGADLTGASLIGAYLIGAKLDGEMVSTKPYVADDISEVEENVYVEDTVKPKSNPATEDITIGSRRDFEETSPAVVLETEVPETKQDKVEASVVGEPVEVVDEHADDAGVPDVSIAAPMSKSAPAMKSVLIEEPQVHAQVAKEKKAEPAEVPVVNEEVATQAEIVEESVPEVIPDEVESGDESIVTDKPVEQEVVFVEEVATENLVIPKKSVDQDIVADQAVEVTQTVMAVVEEETLPENVMINIEKLFDSNNCYGCDLSGAKLSGKNLDSADLEGADLSNANLVGADLEDANLKGANLSNADLSGADLSGADFYKANLSGANLSNAKLEKVLFDDAKMSSVKGYHQDLLLLKTP